MPTVAEVRQAAADAAAWLVKQHGGNPERIPMPALDDLVRWMTWRPHDWGGRDGPNWYADFIRQCLCYALFRRPVHPAELPRPWRTLPARLVVDLQERSWDPDKLWLDRAWDWPPQPGEAREWVNAIAFNRRARQDDWIQWEKDPLAWRHRHAPPEFIQFLRQDGAPLSR